MNICVFCASSPHLEDIYYSEAEKLGEMIVAAKWGLVYGGTKQGAMKSIADAVMTGGGKVKGVIPDCIAELGIKADNITELEVTSDMKERKELMRESADAFIALPGGWGTLEEITEVITLKQLGQHAKPIVFLNTAGFYTPFLEFIKHARERNFISAKYDTLYKVVDNVQDVIDYIRKYKEEKVPVSKY